MREKENAKDNEKVPEHIPSEEDAVIEEIKNLIQRGGRVLKYNHWLPEQNYLTEIEIEGEVRSFHTHLPVPYLVGEEPEKN
jgi:hypothetical protein